MNATRRLIALSTAGVVLLAGCGSSTKASSPNTTPPASDGAGLGTPLSSATSTSDIANIDVCALLSQDDAAATARAHRLNGAQTDATVYTLTATPQTVTGGEPVASCKFAIDGQGSTVVRVGDLMLSAGEDSFTDDFVVDLYRAMVPHLR